MRGNSIKFLVFFVSMIESYALFGLWEYFFPETVYFYRFVPSDQLDEWNRFGRAVVWGKAILFDNTSPLFDNSDVDLVGGNLQANVSTGDKLILFHSADPVVMTKIESSGFGWNMKAKTVTIHFVNGKDVDNKARIKRTGTLQLELGAADTGRGKRNERTWLSANLNFGVGFNKHEFFRTEVSRGSRGTSPFR